MPETHHENIVINTTLGIRFVRSKVTTSGYVPFHWHSSIEIVCVLHGQLRFNISGHSYTVGANQFIIVPSGVVHDVANTPNKAVVMQIPLPALERYVDHPERVSFKNGCHDLPEYHQIVGLINQFDVVEAQQTTAGRFESEIILLQILKLLFTRMVSRKRLPADNSRIKEVIVFINGHYRQKLTVAMLAKKFGYNPSYLSRMFKEQTEISLIKYIYEVKINHFYQDIIKTDRPISDLLRKNGLTNQRTARETFKEMFGILPNELRRQYTKTGVRQD